MPRQKEKTNYVHPIIIYRIKHFCFGDTKAFYERYLKGQVSFDFPRFRSMMKQDDCHEHEEKSLYVRLAAVERLVRSEYGAWDLIDEGQVQWAVRR